MFIAQVYGSLPEVPNFCPARYSTFSTSGRFCSCMSSRMLATIVSIPSAFNSSASPSSVKRDTAITRLLSPASPTARMASLAILGPIFPPAPRIIMSPSMLFMSPISASDGLSHCSSKDSIPFIAI
ncbi:hypothetical protein [Dyadobacter sp. 676]|uniref:Uncharacterized protein n=1 Tax=Dyadobacter sp. 676 TaxID=3088362 RepID=A0AAU8FI36_9BACT